MKRFEAATATARIARAARSGDTVPDFDLAAAADEAARVFGAERFAAYESA